MAFEEDVIVIAAKGIGQDVPVAKSLGRRESIANQRLGHRLVLGQLGELAPLPQVRATVPDVGDDGMPAHHVGTGPGGSHPGQLGVGSRVVADQLLQVGGKLFEAFTHLRPDAGLETHQPGGVPGDEFPTQAEHHFAGHFSGTTPAHAVGDNQHIRVVTAKVFGVGLQAAQQHFAGASPLHDRVVVFVVFPHQSKVRCRTKTYLWLKPVLQRTTLR